MRNEPSAFEGELARNTMVRGRHHPAGGPTGLHPLRGLRFALSDPSGSGGVCKVRFNDQGALRVPWGYTSTGWNPDPIEKKPFFHVLPGSVALSFGVDPSDIFVPMIPAMLAGCAAILVIAWFYGKRERARLGGTHGDFRQPGEIQRGIPDARRPKLIWFNGALTLALMVALIAGLLPLPVLFMVAFNYH